MNFTILSKSPLACLAAALFALSGASSVYADYKSTVLADNPAGYWRLDEASGTTAANLGSLGATGNGTYSATGVTLGASGALVGDADTAIGLNGTSGQVTVPYNAALNPNVFSVEAWASPYQQNPGNYLCVLNAKINSPNKGFLFYLPPNGTDSQWSFWTGNGVSAWNVQGGALASGTSWAHLVGTYDGTNQSFYVNGALYARSKMTAVANPSGGLQIGANSTSYYFKNNIDEVAIYGTALSPNQVLAHYVAARGSNPPPVPPAIVTSPQNQTNYLAQSATFTVWATGSLPFTNEWLFLGTNTSGAGTNVFSSTNNAFVLSSVALTNAGNYAVVVSNNGGSVTSAVATLTVIDITSPTIAPEPQPQTLYAGGTAHFITAATGGGSMACQWQFYSTNLPGATNATLVLTNVQAVNQGNYQLQAANEAGTNFSSLAALIVLPAPQTNTYAGYVMADQPVAYWRLDETAGSPDALDLAGGFNGSYVGPVGLEQPGAITGDSDTAASFASTSSTKVNVPFNSLINPPQFTVECWAKDNGSDTNDYRSPLTSRQDSPQKGFTFYATPAPGNQWQFWDGTGTSWDTITGPTVQISNWTHLVATFDGATKRFFVNGVLVGNSSGACAPNPLNSLKIGVGGGSADSYFFNGTIDDVAVYATALSPARIAAHYAMGLGATNPPAITTQPSSGSVLAGSNITLSVQATGSLPLSCQWQLYGTNLAGQTSGTISVNDAQPANTGPYWVIVSNPAGSITSSVAVVTAVTRTNAYASVVLADGAVGYWRLDETSGTTAANLGRLGSANNGTYNNGVTLGLPGAIAGDDDSSAGFTAANSTTVDVPYAARLNGTRFTAECWAQMTGPGNITDEGFQSPLTSRNGVTAGYIFYGVYGGTWQLWTGTGAGSSDQLIGPAIQLGSWAHLAVTCDGAVKRFYVNGVQVGSSTAAFVPDSATVLRIGGGKTESTPGAYFFQGNVDEVAVYTNALPAATIQAHYAIGAIGPVSTTTVAASPNPAVYGQSVTLTATVSGSGGTPGGTVTFQAATTVLGTSALTEGQASLSAGGLAVAGSPYSITAAYSGDSDYSPGTSAPLAVTVSPKAVQVTADAKSKTYGQADPALTYQITSGGPLVDGDAFSGALSRVAGDSPGTYAILQGDLALSPNYTLTYAGANLTIASGLTPPVISSNSAAGLSLKIAIAPVLAAWTKPVGDTLALLSVTTPSAGGGTVSANSTQIIYNPPAGSLPGDSIAYTVQDQASGATSDGVITINFIKSAGLAQNISYGSGGVTIRFAGIPTIAYEVQKSPTSDFASYDTVLTTNAPPTGLFIYTDTSPPPGSAFYRLMQH